nr:hypothetical protein [Tanacetum cinerariifolium]
MVNVIPPNHVDDVPIFEPDQHDDVPVVPEPILVDEDKDPEEDEFEEEDPKEEEDDIEVDIKEDKNGLELNYPYEEMDLINHPSRASDSEPKDAIKVKNPIEHEDETVPASVHEEGKSSTTPLLREDSDGLFHGLMRRDINSPFGKAKVELILDLVTKCVLAWCKERLQWKKLVEKLGNAEDKVECKKLMNELEEARFSNTYLRMQNERDNVDAAIAAERARHANVGNYARGSGLARGQDATLAARECTFRAKKVRFSTATLQGPTLTWWNSKTVTMGVKTVNQMPWTEMKHLITIEFCPIEEIQRIEHELWNLKVKEYIIVAYTQRFNELAFIRPRMVKPERIKVNAYIRGLTDNIKGEVTSSRPANLNETMHMAHKLMDQKAQARDERILEGKKRKWESFQNCTIKYHKCGKVEHKSRSFVDTRFSSMLDIDPVKIGVRHEVELADGRVVSTNTVLKGCTLNLVNHVFEIDLMPIELGSNKSFVDTRFSVLLDIDPIKIGASYEVELADEREEEEHEKHLKIILELLKKERLYTKFSKCDFWLDSVQFLGHVIDRSGVHYHPVKANVRALMMTIHNDLPKQIREAQEKAMKGENVKAENLGRLIKPIFEFRLMEHVVLRIMFGCRYSGAVRFGKREKLSPRYIEPFKILARPGPRKVMFIPLDEIQLDDKLHMIEEPVKVVEREVKRLRQSRIPIVKVRWNSQRDPEYTWEHEDQIKKKVVIAVVVAAMVVIATTPVRSVTVVILTVAPVTTLLRGRLMPITTPLSEMI